MGRNQFLNLHSQARILKSFLTQRNRVRGKRQFCFCVQLWKTWKHGSESRKSASRDIEHNDLLFSQGNQLALCGRRCHYQRLGEKALAAEEWFWLRAETDYQVCFYISLHDLKLWVNTLLVKCPPGQWGVIHWEAGKKNKKLQVLCYSTQYKTMLPLQVQSSSTSGF